MHTPEDSQQIEVPPVPANRRAMLIRTGYTILATAVVAGIAYAVNSANSKGTLAELASAGDSSSAVLVAVQGHCKMQARGTNWSQHRLIEINEYLRKATLQ